MSDSRADYMITGVRLTRPDGGRLAGAEQMIKTCIGGAEQSIKTCVDLSGNTETHAEYMRLGSDRVVSGRS